MNFKRASYFDTEPGLYTKSILVNFSVLKDQHGLHKFNHIQAELNGNDSCFSTVNDMGYPEQLYFYNGLGGPYYERQYYNDAFYEGQKFNRLVYYKKGNKTWGTPISKTVGLNQVGQPELAQVYPNPTQGLVTISLTTPEQTQFTLFDVLGRVQLTQELHTHQTEINLSHLPKGIYYYTITTNYEKSTNKLLLN
jgi:hypothetical protein